MRSAISDSVSSSNILDGESRARFQASCRPLPWLSRRPNLFFALTVGASLSACGDWTGGNGGNSGSWAPQVTSSFPESGIQSLPEASSITFNAAGNDVDSLDLDWEWQLNNALQAFGELDSGEFDESWTLEWSQDLSGALHDVHFVVTAPTRPSSTSARARALPFSAAPCAHPPSETNTGR